MLGTVSHSLIGNMWLTNIVGGCHSRVVDIESLLLSGGSMGMFTSSSCSVISWLFQLLLWVLIALKIAEYPKRRIKGQ